MTNASTALFLPSLLLSVLVPACEPGADDEDRPPAPMEESWQSVVAGITFPQTGDEAISVLKVGSDDSGNDNFHNRGDIHVRYDGPPGAISVSMKRFGFSRKDGAEVFEKLSFWAYGGEWAPPREKESGGDASCAAGVWTDDCQILVYFDGTNQNVRSGADFYVTLPVDYTGVLELFTEDNATNDSFPSRGDVQVHNLAGSATIKLSSGRADVKLGDINAAPSCAPEAYAACEAVAWDPDATECSCYLEMGVLQVIGAKGAAASVTIDVPTQLWATLNLANEASATQLGCTAQVDCGVFGSCTDDVFDDTELQTLRTINEPDGAAVLANSGYSVSAGSKMCQSVDFIAGPSEWGTKPQSEYRGTVRVCNSCANTEKPGGV
ncbi:MAG: hypothetical protein V3V08_21740 [Nannocystaceae bacterium]